MINYIFAVIPLIAGLLTWFINRRKIFHFVSISSAIVQIFLTFFLKNKIDDYRFIFILINNLTCMVLIFFICNVYSNLILMRVITSNRLGRRYSVAFFIIALANVMVIFGILWVLYLILFAMVLLMALLYHFANDLYNNVRFQIYVLSSTVILSSLIYTVIKTLQNIPKNIIWEYFIQAIGAALIFAGLYFANKEKNIIRFIMYATLVNAGVIFVNLGLDNYAGLYSSLLYLFKSILVYLFVYIVGENISLNYKTDRITDVRGLINENPVLGVLTFLLMFNLCSLPPFPLFFSEMKIIYNMFAVKNYFMSLILIIKNIIFTYIVFKKFIPLIYGIKRVTEKKRDIIFSAGLIVFLLTIILISILMPAKFLNVFNKAVSIILGDL